MDYNYDKWSSKQKIEMSMNKIVEDWQTPSLELMAQMYLFHQEFSKLGDFYGSLEDSHNLWICKPASNARGNGIFVTNNITDILNEEKLDAVGKDTLVQKYIESPLTIQISDLEYKFDIRQWVLVSNLSPLTAYIFSGFYCRMCSSSFDISKYTDTSRHLTNYSLNKTNFKDGKSAQKASVYSDTFLKEYLLTKRGVSLET